MFHASLGLLFISLAPLIATAADEPPKIETRPIVIHPAREPRPGEYQLSYTTSELRDGNAALDLFKAMIIEAEYKLDWEKLGVKPDDVTPEKAAEVVKQCAGIYRYLDYAARCRNCDWQIPWRDEPPFGIVLPELQRLRNLQRLLMIKCLQERREGRIADAVRTLRTGYALARHAAAGPTLVHGLVGTAMIVLANDQLEQVLQHPRCPSLYGALGGLPSPLIDLRPAIRFEASAVDLQFPQIKRLCDDQLTPEEAARVANEMIKDIGPLIAAESDQFSADALAKFMAIVASAAEVPAARKRLQAAGHDPARVEKMPAVQVLVVDSYEIYRRQYSSMSLWFDLPLAEALRSQTEMARLWERPKDLTPLHLFQLVIPAVTSVRKSASRIDRQVAALRVIEAVRLYAAAHAGEFPASLAEINDNSTAMFVPNDPFRGEPFEYTRDGNTAVLVAPTIAGDTSTASAGRRYELKRAMK